MKTDTAWGGKKEKNGKNKIIPCIFYWYLHKCVKAPKRQI